MYLHTIYGAVWVSDQPPYYRDWRGRQAYRFLYAPSRERQSPQTAG